MVHKLGCAEAGWLGRCGGRDDEGRALELARHWDLTPCPPTHLPPATLRTQGRVYAMEYKNATWIETTTLTPTDFLTRASPYVYRPPSAHTRHNV
jgi:hypothetical protein